MGITAKILDERHQDYDAPMLARRRALYEGGKATRKIMRTLLPKMPREPGPRYNDRINRAVYFNYSGPICNFYASYLFSKPPRVEVDGKAGDWYAGDKAGDDPGFLENVDRKGSTWAGFWRERLIDAFVGRCAYVWVNLPKGPEEARLNRAEQEQAGDLEAYLVRITPEEVINWEEDETGALSWIQLRQELGVRSSVTEPRRTVIRWTNITAAEIVTWEWAAKEGQAAPGPEDEIPLKSRVDHGAGMLPVVRLKLPEGFWLMEQLHDPAMACFFAENDLGWATYNTAHAMFYILSKWEEQAPDIGDGYYLQLHRDKEGSDEAGWLEIGGASHEVLRKRVLDLRQELYRVANQLALAGNGGSAEVARSGASKEMDYQSVAIVAREFGAMVRASMRQTIRLVSKMRDDGASPNVSGLEGYKAIDVQAFLDAAAMAKPIVKSETFQREVAKAVVRHTLGETLEKEIISDIEKEIEDADYSVESVAPYTPPPPPEMQDDEDDDDEA